MSKMKWLTKEEVRAYATTPERAFDISIKHHQQNVDATEEELTANRAHPLAWALCGLCQHYASCGECPLVENGVDCYDENSLYRKSLRAYDARPFNHKAFIKAETALLDRLKQLKSGDSKMDKKEIKIRIEQAGQHKAEVTAALDKKIEQLQSELAACEPELKCGDYGFDEHKGMAILIAPTQNMNLQPMTSYCASGNSCGFVVDGKHCTRNINKLGNIFADLALLAEPLEEFEVYGIDVKLDSDGYIHFGEEARFSLCPQFQDEFCQKLNQVRATAKRKAAK